MLLRCACFESRRWLPCARAAPEESALLRGTHALFEGREAAGASRSTLLSPRVTARRAQVAATCKHFAAYSLEAAEGYTRQTFDAPVSERCGRRACYQGRAINSLMCLASAAVLVGCSGLSQTACASCRVCMARTSMLVCVQCDPEVL